MKKTQEPRRRPAPTLNVLLVEDHLQTRREVCKLIETETDITVVAQSANAEDGLRCAREAHPSVVVMDLGLPGMNGLAATRYLLAETPTVRVLVLSNHVGRDLVRTALAAGATGFVRKDRAFEELIPAIRAVSEGREFLGQGLDEQRI